jgi:phosphopantothenoylcysteine decarboxylase
MSKNLVLGVTGSIAAYKAADLTSQLTKLGCDVRVVMTADALRFITALAFKTLSRHPVITDLYDEEEGWKPTHIRLADEADLLLIAPATANTIARMAHGIADDALGCIALALNPRARILFAPAMNGKMLSLIHTDAADE